MCQSPNRLADGTQVACHDCWQCRNARIDDWVGRCIAESRTVAASHAVTLTYGRKAKDVNGEWIADPYGDADHPSAAVLTYSDVQKYFKKLRFAGHKLRYFVVGEYGSMKGRAHWHVIIFWLGSVPEHVLGERFDEKHWEHGLSFWTAPSYEDFRYNCKYIQKDIGEAERQGHLSMSKKPPLGAKYFRDLAARYAREGLVPQGEGRDEFGGIGRFTYTFPEAVRRNGQRVVFHLRGGSASEALFLQAYVDAWRELYGDKPFPSSKLLEEFLDPYSHKPTPEWRAEK